MMCHGSHLVLFATSIFISSALPSQGCSGLISGDQSANELRQMLNAADFVFIGQVKRVTKRRWGPDDQIGMFETQLKKWQGEGRELPDADQRILTFSDAEARLSILWSMKDDGLDSRQGRAGYGVIEVDVDLLRPVRSPGDGGCTSFPSPCPWDITVGDMVAIALEQQPFRLPDTTFCLKVSPLNLAQSDRIKSLRGKVDAAEVFWPFVEAAWKL
jgi:hypothetical protein